MSNEKQRERLLHILSDAPFEIILNAVEDFKAFKIRQSEATNAVFKYFGDGKTRQEVPPPSPSVEESPSPKPDVKFSFIKPPGVATAKIGGETEKQVIAHLRSGPDNIQALSAAMGRNEKAAEGLLARLCEKEKIRYRSDKLYCLVE